MLQIIVENILGGAGQEVVVDVWPTDTIGSLKETVCQTLMINPIDTMIAYNGKPLDDYMTIAQLAIPENARLQLMLRYAGGA